MSHYAKSKPDAALTSNSDLTRL